MGTKTPTKTPTSRKERRWPYQPTTPELESWRKLNPFRIWFDAQPRGTLARVARDLELATKTIYAWLDGRSLPPADRLLDFCDRCKVDIRVYIRWWKRHPGNGPQP